jgi:hypothetical protein
MHLGKMHNVKAVYMTNDVVTGGIEAWWAPGSELYLYQEWRPGFTDEERNYSQVNVDPMYGDNLGDVIAESWNAVVIDYMTDYTG